MRAPVPHLRDAICRFQRTNQDRTRRALARADEIQAPVDAVGPIDIGVARRAEHHRIALGTAAIGMRGRLSLVIGLGLDDHAPDAVNGELAPDQGPRDVMDAAVKEAFAETARHVLDGRGLSVLLLRQNEPLENAACPIRAGSKPAGSNWGDFGADDQLGRLNLLTPEKVLQGVAEVKEGLTFCLTLPLDYPGGNVLNPRRNPPLLAPTHARRHAELQLPDERRSEAHRRLLRRPGGAARCNIRRSGTASPMSASCSMPTATARPRSSSTTAFVPAST